MPKHPPVTVTHVVQPLVSLGYTEIPGSPAQQLLSPSGALIEYYLATKPFSPRTYRYPLREGRGATAHIIAAPTPGQTTPDIWLVSVDQLQTHRGPQQNPILLLEPGGQVRFAGGPRFRAQRLSPTMRPRPTPMPTATAATPDQVRAIVQATIQPLTEHLVAGMIGGITTIIEERLAHSREELTQAFTERLEPLQSSMAAIEREWRPQPMT